MPNARPLLWSLFLLLALPAAVRAETDPSRNGFYAGIGYGGSWAKVELDAGQESQWSGTLALRAGWALRQDLLLGGEYMRWAKGYEIPTLQGDIPYEVTLEGALAVVTYFPGNGGFVMRGGLGAAFADVEIGAAPAFGTEQTGLSADPGIAVLAAAGYEARLTDRFALGVDFDVLYLGVSGDGLDRAYLYGLKAELNWYW